ncbi:MAG TPA: hypothetical protein VGC42_25955 [Kofleriaceae bacterium]
MIDHEGLGPEARALLDLARGGLSPDAAALQRVRGKLGAATATAAAGSAIGVKLALVSVAIAVAAGAGLYLRRDRIAVAPAPAIELAATPSAQLAREVAVPRETVPPALAVPVPPPRHLAASPPAPATSPPVPAAPAGLAREVELVDLAMAMLRAQRPGDALRAVHRHALETAGQGQLAEDAAAIEIEALCQLHDASTPDQLAAFDARFPHSAQRSRLSSRCP